MGVFTYQQEIRGKIVTREVNAKTIQLAKLKLKSKNIDPIHIQKKAAVAFFSGGNSLKTEDVLFFTRQISFLLSSGLSLIRAINLCMDMTENIKLKMILKDILVLIERGKTFSQALRTRTDVFDGFYVNMIVCAEETGLLDKTLKDLADYIEKSEGIKKKVRSAMVYPILVLAISLSIIMGIIIFVVPKFEALYSSGGSDLPAITQLFVNLSNALRTNWVLLLGVAVGVPICLFQYLKTESGKSQFQSLVRTLPIFGKLQYKSSLARFCRAFYSLLTSGVDFLEALNIASNVSSHKEIIRGINISKNYVSQGKGFAKGLQESKVFPSLLVNMTAIGEESGRLDSTYEKLTSYYEREVEDLVSNLIKMIEPLMIVFLGGMIGTIILALYLPVFNMGELV